MNKFKETDRVRTIRDLEPDLEEKDDVEIECVILGHSDIEHMNILTVMLCENCKNQKSYDYPEDFKDWRKFKTPDKCPNCGKEWFPIQESKGRIMQVLIQDGKSDENPLTMSAYVFGDHPKLIEAGMECKLRGTLRSWKKHKNDLTYTRVFDVNHIGIKNTSKVMPTDKEIEKFKKLTIDDLVDSYAPNIKNMRLIKEGIIVSIVGGVEYEDVSGLIHVFLVGDPGTAKTKLLEFITKIVQKSDYASGKSSSAAGLLGGVDNLSDGTRVARAGPIVMCNNGVVALDEMDKMNQMDRNGLHEAMASRRFSLKKIGINRSWPTNTTIIGAANPKGGNRWDTDISIKENVKLSDSLLSRFGLIFLIRDVPSPSNDMEIASHILKVRQRKVQSVLDSAEFMKFINYVKTFKPYLTDEAGLVLTEYWTELRQISQPMQAPQVDHRTLEDLNRIAESYAKLRCSDKVERQDAQRAIKILKESLHTLGMNTPGERNKSIGDSMGRQEFLHHIFSDPITESMAIVEMLKRRKQWKSEFQAKKEILGLKNMGYLSESEDGLLQWVD